MPPELKECFRSRSIPVTELGACHSLPSPVSGHIDLQIAELFRKYFIASEVWDRTKELRAGRECIKLSTPLGNHYPEDVPLSFRVIGNLLLCNPETIAPEILQYAADCDLKVCAVKQGYAACSALVLPNRAKGSSSVITDDLSIYIALRQESIDVLQISKGSIALPGYSYGFIGGASAVISDIVYFFGDLEMHTDGGVIRSFLQERGIPFYSLRIGTPMIDIGGVIVID